MSKLLKVLEDVQQKRQELTEQVKAVLNEGLAEFMKEHPSLKAIGWTQYTPYFCDGDPCVFGVGEMYASFTDHQPESFYDDDGIDANWISTGRYYNDKVPEGTDAQTWVEINEFCDRLQTASEDLQAAFGDHVRVVVTQSGVDVEEYEHD